MKTRCCITFHFYLNSQTVLFSGLPTTAKMAANSNLALILTPFINIYIYIIYQYIHPRRQKIDSNLRIYQGKKIFGKSFIPSSLSISTNNNFVSLFLITNSKESFFFFSKIFTIYIKGVPKLTQDLN